MGAKHADTDTNAGADRQTIASKAKPASITDADVAAAIELWAKVMPPSLRRLLDAKTKPATGVKK